MRMKVSRKQLRKLIKGSLLEVYDPTLDPEIIKQAADKGLTVQQMIANMAPADAQVRGLLSKETNEKYKEELRKYHLIYKDEIKKFFNAIKTGTVTCMHSITYGGVATGDKSSTNTHRNWINNFGTRGKHQLSTVLFPKSLDSLKNNPNIHTWNVGGDESAVNTDKILISRSMILEGYPTIIAKEDFMSQTITGIPQGLKDHQKHSGISKTITFDHDDKKWLIHNFDDFMSAGIPSQETIVDNWKVKALYAHESFFGKDFLSMSGENIQPFLLKYLNALKDSVAVSAELGIPFYLVHKNKKTSSYTCSKFENGINVW